MKIKLKNKRIADFLSYYINHYKLINKFGFLKNYDALFPEQSYKLQKDYSEYVSNISSVDMAISIELAVFLNIFVKYIQPKSILDLGSGFSSYIFRKCSKDIFDGDLNIITVDDDSKWLNKTKTFLTGKNLNTSDIISWDEFIHKNNYSNYDLVFHDLGNMETRISSLRWLLDNNLISKNTILILDDIHKEDYFKYITDTFKNYNYNKFDIKNITRDGLLRYAGLYTEIYKQPK